MTEHLIQNPRRTGHRAAGALLVALCLSGTPALAQGSGDACGIEQPASPGSNEGASISFRNETPYAYRIYWANFDGVLAEFAMSQPFENHGFDTYADHAWYIEIYVPDGSVCLGPVAAPAGGSCEMRVVFDEGEGTFGLDGSGCYY